MLKTFISSLLITVIIVIISWFIVAPLLLNVGYSSVESTNHQQTHALLVTLIFTIITCTIIIIEKMKKTK